MPLSDLEKKFIREVDFVNAKTESIYSLIDGQLKKTIGGTEKVSSHDVITEFQSEEIQTIHNHPTEYPPSNNDIFILLYSGRHTRDSVILPSGKIYIMKRTPSTHKFGFIKPLEGIEITQGVIKAVNSNFRSNRLSFGKTYNQFLKINIDQAGITTREELNKRTPELEEKTLYKLAEIYGFNIDIEYVTPKAKPIKVDKSKKIRSKKGKTYNRKKHRRRRTIK